MHFQKLLQAVKHWRLFCRIVIFARTPFAARFFCIPCKEYKKEYPPKQPFNRYSITLKKYFQKVLIFSMFLLDFSENFTKIADKIAKNPSLSK